VALLFSIGLLSAQSTNYLSSASLPSNLSQNKLNFVTKMNTDAATLSLQYVSFGNFSNSLNSNDGLNLILPGFNTTVSAAKIKFSYEDADNYQYMGRLTNEAGYLMFVKKKGYLAGFIQTDDHFWELLPLTTGISLLREQDVSDLPNDVCGTTLMGNQMGVMTEPCDEEPTDCIEPIHVLILFDDDVPGWYGDNFDGWAGLSHLLIGIFSFELAAMNSGIPVDLAISFDGPVAFANTIATPAGAGDDLASFRDGIGSTWREEYRADLVVLMTAFDYIGIAGVATGGGPCEDCAFAIVEVPAIVSPRWSMAHELAHLFAALHNRNANVPCQNCGNNQDDCRHGWRFTQGGQDRTIMAMLFNADIDNGSVRALHFANPDVAFNGFATGTEDDNNALVIRNAECEIANYRPHPYFNVGLFTQTIICGSVGEIFPLTTNVDPGAPVYFADPPYTYSWQSSSPWVLTVNGSGANPSAQVNTNNGGSATLTVTVTASDGQVTSKSVSVTILAENDPTCLTGGGGSNRSTAGHTEEHITGSSLSDSEIQPNPFWQEITMSLPKGYEGTPACTLMDTKGSIIRHYPAIEVDKQTIDLESLPSGLYFIQLQDENETIIKKLIKQ
jgi:Secretion system C-terminal sorting domain/Metallo-peptidase family M12